MTRSSADSTFDLPSVLSLGRTVPDYSSIQADVLVWFDASRDPLLRYVCSFGIGMRDAEDIVQDTFVALYRHLLQGKPQTNLQGWLFRVAHNLALKHRARQRVDAHRLAAVEHAATRHAAGQDPERALETQERYRKAVAVLRALPERERRCLFLRAEGLPYRSIARVLGISLGAVAKSLARSVGRLGRVAGR